MLSRIRGLLAGLLALVAIVPLVNGEDPPAAPEYNFDKAFTQKWTTTVKQTLTVTGGKTHVNEQSVVLQVNWTPEAAKDDDTAKKVAEKAVTDAKIKQAAAAKALEDNKDDAKKKDLEKAVTEADDVLKKAEDALKNLEPKPKDGIVSLKLKLESVKIKIDSEVSGVEGSKKTIDFPTAQKLEGLEFTVKIKKADMSVEMPDAVKVLETIPELKDVLTKDQLRQFVAASFPALPWKKGEKKELKPSESKSAFGTYKTTATLTNEDTKEKVVTVKSLVKVEFIPAKDSTDPVKVTEMKLIPELEGTIEFDTAAGQISKSTLVAKKATPKSVKITVEDKKIDATVVQDYSLTVETAK